MLCKLHIENYALIQELTLDFASGLTVVTGETGSGKSILLGALGLALGDRATSSSLRYGAKQCVVEATFKSKKLSVNLESWEITPNADNYIYIRRELTATGRSKAFVNDSQTSVSNLKEIGSLLVDLHGQDETRSLMERNSRLDLLDSFGGHSKVRDSYRASFSRWRTANQKLADLEAIASKPQSDLNYLQFQIEELNELNLESTNWSELEDELNKLNYSTELACGFNNTHELIESLNLNAVAKILDKISSFSNEAENLTSRFNSTRIELEDISHEASRLAENVEFNPDRLNIVEEKLDSLKRTLHKHKLNSIEELSKLKAQIDLQIENASNLEEEVENAKDELYSANASMLIAGEALLKARVISGKELLSIVHSELFPLKLSDVQMNWKFSKTKYPDLHGIENVELMFSANVGSPEHPITQIASGGERSRIMLAFKAAIATKSTVPTIVLDEIDTGVSGDVASRMAGAMKRMSQGQQVFSVTHLAQVAAKGDSHLEITKHSDKNTTNTHAKFLHEEECNEAIARMLSGSAITEEARAQARVLRTSNQ